MQPSISKLLSLYRLLRRNNRLYHSYRLSLKHIWIWLPVCLTNSIWQCRELTKIAGEFHMMNTMACRSINHWVIGHVLSIMNQNRPDVNEDKEW